MRIVCIGGGPAGLYFAILMKKLNAAHHITVVERNKPYDTFGWGVVFSDATMQNMRIADPETAAEIEAAFNHWDDIEVLIKGRRMRTFSRRVARRWGWSWCLNAMRKTRIILTPIW
jgi:anthraniloyl-CoA monooxygenase